MIEPNKSMDLYSITEAPIVLDAEDEHLRPYIEQLNATGKVEVTELSNRRETLGHYYRFFYHENYLGDGRWEGYLRGFKTKEQREEEAKTTRRIARDNKLIDAIAFVVQFIRVFLKW